ncbi:DUF1700 domain-containing protein [Clostridiales bacterium COT073_COT-073]|nr:DUF1700 domain-containing protein [Clostridiales bacterium COT073_COT-073]
MNKGQNKQLEKYLSQLDSYLRYIPVSEKTDILSELKSTFYERINNGQSEESIVIELGTPKELAMSYMGESIIKNKGFSFRRFMMVVGFYSFVSMTWMSIIPTLAVLSISFFFSSVVSALAGIMGLLKGIVHISLIDNMKFIFFIYELKGVPALIVGVLLAVIFIGLGILCWKGTIQIISFLQVQRWKLNNKGNWYK